MQQTRVNFLGARGIEAVVAIDHTRGNQVALWWLLYDGHGNLVRTLSPDYTLSAFQWRGVWGEVQGSLGTGRGYCANLGHPEDETGLVYMRARYYEPATGRFISEDPARDGVNWYLYAEGNPICMRDDSGFGPGRDFVGAVIGTMIWMVYIAKVNPAFAALFCAWSVMMGVGFAFWAVGEHSNDGEVRNFGFQLQFSWGMTLTGSVLIMASTINNAIRANASLQGQVAEFWLGYALMLYTTVVLLDIEVEVSTGTSFLDQMFVNL